MEKNIELCKAVIKVMKAVKSMEKNSEVGTGGYGYKGTKDSDVKQVFNTEMEKNGLCMIPIDIEDDVKIDRWEESGKVKQSVFVSVKTKYLLMHESGESMQVCGYGHGVDSQDKAAGKATTYAMKNALLYSFMTPVGNIDDSDTTHSNDIDVPQKSSSQQKNDLPWLNEGTPEYDYALKRLKEGVDISEIKKHYRISRKTLEKLKA